jgi:hypothetical protein
VETNLSSQSKSFLVSPSTCTCVHVLYSASEKTSKSIQTVGSPGGLTVPVRGLPLALKPSAMVRSREAWPYFLPRHSGLITCTEYNVLVYMAKGIVLGADRWIRRLYFHTVRYLTCPSWSRIGFPTRSRLSGGRVQSVGTLSRSRLTLPPCSFGVPVFIYFLFAIPV